MRRYRRVNPRIWNDEKFRTLGTDGRLAFLFLLTHPDMTACGGMRANVSGLSAELLLDESSEENSLRRCLACWEKVSGMGMAEMDSQASLVVLPHWMRYNEPENSNSVKAYGKAFHTLPECGLLMSHLARVYAYVVAMGRGWEKYLPTPDMPIGHGSQMGMPGISSEGPVVPGMPIGNQGAGSLEPRLREDRPEQGEFLAEHYDANWTNEAMEYVVASWNEMAEAAKLSTIRGMPEPGDDRHAKLKDRVNDSAWWEQIDFQLQYVGDSKFLRGGGDRGWRATFNWFIRKTTLRKIQEGEYDDNRKDHYNPGPGCGDVF